MQYKIIVDKQSRTNPSSEKKEYIIDIEELRVLGDVYDSLVITPEEDYVMRRLKLSEYHVLSVLEEPIKQPITDVKIELFEGDNYIYLVDMTGNKFYAEYLIKNDFNNTFATRAEMNSIINQTAQSIELSVNQKFEGYSTTEEMNAAINVKADSITNTVSKTYATKGELSTAKSEIKQTTDSITSTVSKKVGNDEIISKINQSAEEILINADKIDIDGKSVHFKTNISYTVGPFTQEDKQKVVNYIMETGSLTSEEFKKYDINGNGMIDSGDTFLMTLAINNGGYYTFSGTYEIDPYSKDKSVAIYNNRGYYSAIISLVYNYLHNLYVNQLNIDEGDINTYLGASIFHMSQNDNFIYIQIGEDWYNNESACGISVSHKTANKIGSNNVDIIAQEDDAFITINSERVEAYYTLYANESGTNGTLSLAVSSSNFNSIEIFYGKGREWQSSVKVSSPNGKKATLQLLLKSGGLVQAGAKQVSIAGNTISVPANNYGGANLNANASVDVYSTNEIYIFKVVGYK